MRGLVFEGGGAKGAYQAGAVKALNKRKIKFDGVAGTSIGSINAAYYASKDFNKLYKLWLSTDSKELFGIEGELLQKITRGNFNYQDLKCGIHSVLPIIKNGGIELDNIKKILNKTVNENKIRKNNIDFALVTFNLSNLKPVQIYKDDIPKGKIVDYIIASSYLPFFKFERIIDDNFYLDGGVYSRCPIDLFIDKNYDEIFVIRAWRYKKIKYNTSKNTKIHIIAPKEDLGSIMCFCKEASKYRFNLGYFDTLKYLDNLDGFKYYFNYKDDNFYNNLFTSRQFKNIVYKYSKLGYVKNNKKFILTIIENICDEFKIERFKIYNVTNLLFKIKFLLGKNKNTKYKYFINNIKIN